MGFLWAGGGLLHAFLVFFESFHEAIVEMLVPGEHSAKWNNKVIMVTVTQDMEGGHIITVGLMVSFRTCEVSKGTFGGSIININSVLRVQHQAQVEQPRYCG